VAKASHGSIYIDAGASKSVFYFVSHTLCIILAFTQFTLDGSECPRCADVPLSNILLACLVCFFCSSGCILMLIAFLQLLQLLDQHFVAQGF